MTATDAPGTSVCSTIRRRSALDRRRRLARSTEITGPRFSDFELFPIVLVSTAWRPNKRMRSQTVVGKAVFTVRLRIYFPDRPYFAFLSSNH